MKIDSEKCIGCGLCESISENFRLKDGKADYVFVEEDKEGDMQAKDNCPEQAISE